jgi:hypothetical protein
LADPRLAECEIRAFYQSNCLKSVTNDFVKKVACFKLQKPRTSSEYGHIIEP